MQTKSIVFLSIIIGGCLVGTLTPISAMIGFPISALFTAFFIPHFGMKKCLTILMALFVLTTAINFQYEIGTNMALATTVCTIWGGLENDYMNKMKDNMTQTDFQGNITEMKKTSIYQFYSFIKNSDPFTIAVLMEIITAPIVKFFWFFIAYWSLKKTGFYKRIFSHVKTN